MLGYVIVLINYWSLINKVLCGNYLAILLTHCLSVRPKSEYIFMSTRTSTFVMAEYKYKHLVQIQVHLYEYEYILYDIVNY